MPLGRGEAHLLAVASDLLGREVDREVGGLDQRLLLRRGRAAQRGAQPREELVHAERLRDVVVGAGVERGDLVALGVAHREHDDRHLGPAPQASDHVDAVDPGQAEVEHDHVGVLAGREVERVLAVGRDVDVVTRGHAG